MSGNSEQLKHPYALAIQHHEFVSNEFTEYFKMYMQSWSIVGSIIFVGIIFAVKNGESSQIGTLLRSKLLCVTPILLLLWFLPTCWFWAYFDMYRKYLRWLEHKMPNLQGAPENIVCFHSYRHNWFEDNWSEGKLKNKVQKGASIVAILLVFLVYAGLVWTVLGHYCPNGKMFWILTVIYIVALIFSTLAAFFLLRRIRSPSEVDLPLKQEG